MGLRSKWKNRIAVAALAVLAILTYGCSSTQHLKQDEYLLRKNTVKLQTNKTITRRGELRENLEALIMQQPNRYLFKVFPVKLWLYNARFHKYERDSNNFQLSSRSVERPVVFDTSLMRRSAENMRNYLFNQGYFYPEVYDTVVFRKRKAYVTYTVNTGVNYLINRTTLDVDDSTILKLVEQSMGESVLKPGAEFSMSLLEQERARITNQLREHGYYRFTQENVIDFNLDTATQAFRRTEDNPFESAINFLALQKKTAQPTLDIKITIRTDNPDAYRRYRINRVAVYPDWQGREDVRDSTMHHAEVNGVTFRYHDYYVRENVISKRLFLEPGKYYRQSDYDATINMLNRLGVFQTIRIVLVEDTTEADRVPDGERRLNAYVLLNPSRKYDFTANFEVSTGTTYFLGAAPTLTFRDKNLGRGANVLTTSVSGGLESIYDSDYGNSFIDHFSLLTRTYSFNASLDLPKFLSPVAINFSKRNAPRTIIGFGSSLIERINYFTLTNTAANFSYNWRETSAKTWDLTPAFVNNIRLPAVSDSFNRRLENNDFLRNSYRETFIEGENIGFTFSNQFDNQGRSYTYIKLNAEEAGGLMSVVDGLHKLEYAQYVKFDFDTRRYINYRKSQIALRFYGGVGIPYGHSPTLPYLKQYFVGGAYSIRGWRIRSLGPGSYFDDDPEHQDTYIDRTGDIKLEWNAEYRFDVIQLFGGSIRLKGAVFSDAGNIWLSKPSANYPGGEFALSKLGHDIAISSGAGARLDIASFFILRFDVAFPLKVPYAEDGGWTLKSIRFGSPEWRSDNIILNVAVGYPF